MRVPRPASRARSGGSSVAASTRALCAAAVVAWAVGACSSAPTPAPPGPAVDAADRPFLLSPAEGVPAGADAAGLQRLHSAWDRLLRGDVGGAGSVAESALAVDPELAPALVLRAEVEIVRRDLAAARDTLAPVVARHPEYLAAGMAAGRVAELLGDLPAAYIHFRRLAPASPAALERAGALHGRVVAILGERVADALRRNRVDEARASLGQLRDWAPGERSTLESAIAVARAADEPREELVAVRELVARGGADPALVERRGELELSVGEPGVAIEIFTDLARRHPDEPRYAQSLDQAKFRWRASNLPEGVLRLLAKPELLRADYAVLLYWLVPGVRAGVASSARIATDILEHPQRQEIMRVVNLQLMDVDDTLRRFEPGQRVRRVVALRALLRVLQRAPAAPSCVQPLSGNTSPSREAVCNVAAACGFLLEPAECLPEAGLSGDEAAGWLHRTQTLLGS